MLASMEKGAYRPEIDGLRAIAVVVVLVFHARLSLFGAQLTGGYVGVDVFFVISGYLIARLIWGELSQGTFSLLSFFERRARRILPALIFVACVTTLCSLFVLPRAGLRHLLESVVSVLTFSSNIYFWSESGYFGAAGERAPLLHTWSLAIEEQFYLVFPLFLLAVRRLRRFGLVALLSSAACLSFALAEWASAYHPVASFYWLPTRAWELLAGALVALWESGSSPAPAGGWRNRLNMLGLVLVAAAATLMDVRSRHPGWVTLLPVVGTCLLLRYGSTTGLVGRFLSWRPLVHLGLISYSLYLWHQPVLSLARALHPQALPWTWTVGLLVFCLILSELSYRFVEGPLRKRSGTSSRRVLSWAGAASALGILSAGAGALLFPPNDAAALAEISIEAPRRTLSYESRPSEYRSMSDSWVIVGDCHAGVLSRPLEQALRARGASLRNLAQNGCPYVPGFDHHTPRLAALDCAQKTHQVEQWLLSAPPHTVVIVYRAPLYLHGTAFDNGEGGVEWSGPLEFSPVGSGEPSASLLARAMKSAVEGLLEAGHRVIVVYPLPELGWEPIDRLLEHKGAIDEATASVDHHRFIERSRSANETFDAIFEHPRLLRVRPESVLCETTVAGRCVALREGKLLYVDNNHLSLEGAQLLSDLIFQELDGG